MFFSKYSTNGPKIRIQFCVCQNTFGFCQYHYTFVFANTLLLYCQDTCVVYCQYTLLCIPNTQTNIITVILLSSAAAVAVTIAAIVAAAAAPAAPFAATIIITVVMTTVFPTIVASFWLVVSAPATTASVSATVACRHCHCSLPT